MPAAPSDAPDADPPATSPGQVVVIGAGPAGLTAAYELGKRGGRATVAGGRRRGRRHQPHGGGRRLPLRHRRSPVLHEGPRGRGAVARDPPRRGLPPPPAVEPHLLPGEVLRLPAQAVQRAAHARGDRGRALRAVVPLGARPAAEGPVHARGLRRRQLRLAALRALLQGLQHQGVGGAAVGDLRRVGRAAHQGDDPLERGVGARPGALRREARQGASRSPA